MPRQQRAAVLYPACRFINDSNRSPTMLITSTPAKTSMPAHPPAHDRAGATADSAT